MSKLIPVKRVNKNGVLVTKHVRADSSETTRLGTPLPSPTIVKTTESLRAKQNRMALERRLKRLEKPRNRSISRKKLPLYGTPVLEKYFKNSYKLSCSDNDFYTVFEKLRLSDTVILLAAGLKAEQRDEFIARNNFQYYVEDNSELVDGLRTRGIPLESYLEVAHNHFIEYRETPLKLDAAELHSMFRAADHDDEYSPKKTLVNYVGSDMVSLDDVKNLGLDRCSSTEFFDILSKMHKGTAKCTSSELARILDRIDSEKDYSTNSLESRIVAAVMARSAVTYGIDFANSITSPMAIYYAEEATSQMDEEKAMSYLSYVDETTWDEPIGAFDDDSKWVQVTEHKKTLWEAGIAPEAAREGLKDGMTAHQIIGVYGEGIEPVVSSGWL